MPRHRLASFRLLATASLLALLAACETTPSGPGPASVARAERLLRQGNLAEAARTYEQLAIQNPPPERDGFALAAARAWLDDNRPDDAQRALGLAGAQLPAAQQFERELLQVEVGAARGQYQAAWEQVAGLAEPAQRENAARLFHLRQQVGLRAGQTAAAVQAGIERERIAPDEPGRNRARSDLLTDLRAAIDRGLRVDPAASTNALERGWLELAQLAADVGRSPLSANAMIQRWRERFPGHPASTIVISDILDPAARPGGRDEVIAAVGPVALLLPLSDRGLGRIAALIRDGFQSGMARMPRASVIDLRIYDTSTLTVAGAIRAAVADGAGFIVGPLTKEEVLAAALERPAHVPALLLNTLPPGGGGIGVWQYALAPEDEARQIARQIAGPGGRNAVVLVPAGDWGNRVAAAFADELRLSGGAVQAEGAYLYDYDMTNNTIEPSITAVLGIDAGRARHRRVQDAVGGRLQFEAHPAPGIDAIFAAGYDPQALRQINPLLSHHYAGDLPTFITSDGVTDDPVAIRDLEGMRLLDMPWILDTVGVAHATRVATQPSWSQRGGLRDSRYFAFGYDAAMLTAALRRGLVDWPLDGVTGRLSLAPEGRIERQLEWGRISKGEVVAADPLLP